VELLSGRSEHHCTTIRPFSLSRGLCHDLLKYTIGGDGTGRNTFSNGFRATRDSERSGHVLFSNWPKAVEENCVKVKREERSEKNL
jgi:hypothetical protein